MQETIRIIIVEDEEIWLKTLEKDLMALGFDIAGSAANSEAAMDLLSGNNDYDIALLDININGKNRGLELGKMVSTVYKKPFIFITATQSEDLLQQAMDAQPAAFLLKPANKISLLVAIQNAIQNHQKNALPTTLNNEEVNDFIFVKLGNKYKKINWKEVVTLTSDGQYTKLLNATDKNSYSIRSTMTNTMKYYLPVHIKDKFFQLNRAEAVNIDFIEELGNDNVVTRFGKIPYSEANGKELKKKLNISN